MSHWKSFRSSCLVTSGYGKGLKWIELNWEWHDVTTGPTIEYDSIQRARGRLKMIQPGMGEQRSIYTNCLSLAVFNFNKLRKTLFRLQFIEKWILVRGWSSSSSPIHSLSHSHASCSHLTLVFCSACCALSDQQADKKRHFIYIYLSSANLFSSAECKQCISLSPGVLPCTFNQVNFLSEAFPHGMNNSTDMHSIPFHSVCAIHIRISFNRGWGGGSQEDERRQEGSKRKVQANGKQTWLKHFYYSNTKSFSHQHIGERASERTRWIVEKWAYGSAVGAVEARGTAGLKLV